jgi:hypothetical protein
LCPGLARFRDAARAENMLALSVALTEGAAAAFTQPSHVVVWSLHPPSHHHRTTSEEWLCLLSLLMSLTAMQRSSLLLRMSRLLLLWYSIIVLEQIQHQCHWTR